jgi:hypothetical protein
MTKGVFPFDLLPAELRIKIYNYATVACETAVEHLLQADDKGELYFSGKAVWTRLSSISKANSQYRQEYLDELLKSQPQHEVQIPRPQTCSGISVSSSKKHTMTGLTIRMDELRLNTVGTECLSHPRNTGDTILRKATYVARLVGEINACFPLVKELRVVVSGLPKDSLHAFAVTDDVLGTLAGRVFAYRYHFPLWVECFVLRAPDMSGRKYVKQDGKWTTYAVFSIDENEREEDGTPGSGA